MPHRIVIACPNCKNRKGDPIEITEVTIWIDEDKKLYFIANCDACEQTQTVQTSTEELALKHFHRNEAPASAPLYVI
ncbi:MAG TPA: hypothetical protein VE974_06045 [Thermoanaerobaculia bacterium]|nr:hypothetical protein [Thermoanaerobaculia bacterium]